jgi:hypothetical protein
VVLGDMVSLTLSSCPFWSAGPCLIEIIPADLGVSAFLCIADRCADYRMSFQLLLQITRNVPHTLY